MSNETQSHLEHLQKILGFDPTKKDNITTDALAEVVAEIKAEKLKSIKEKAKVQLMKAMELQDSKVKLDRDYLSASKKWDKEMGKILRQIDAMISGKPAQEEEKEGDKTD